MALTMPNSKKLILQHNLSICRCLNPSYPYYTNQHMFNSLQINIVSHNNQTLRMIRQEERQIDPFKQLQGLTIKITE